MLLVFALHALFRRFCRGLEMPLVWLTVLSPSILPTFSLILDVPALALSLTAVALFLWASERGSISMAILAGLIVGVATETKYTAFITPIVLVLAGLLFRRLRLSLLAAGLAFALFAGWEIITAQLYGESHFLHSFQGQSHGLMRIFHLALPLVGILGGVAPVLALLGLSALGWSRRAVLAGAGVVAVGYALLICIPDQNSVFLRDPVTHRDVFSLNTLVFGAFGVAVCAISVMTAWRLVHGAPSERHPMNWFLVLWLGLELANYFAVSPFPQCARGFAGSGRRGNPGGWAAGGTHVPAPIPPVARKDGGAGQCLPWVVLARGRCVRRPRGRGGCPQDGPAHVAPNAARDHRLVLG